MLWVGLGACPGSLGPWGDEDVSLPLCFFRSVSSSFLLSLSLFSLFSPLLSLSLSLSPHLLLSLALSP